MVYDVQQYRCLVVCLNVIKSYPFVRFSSENNHVVSFFQVRDYIHVIDLADGHIAALQKLSDPSIGVYLLAIRCRVVIVIVYRIILRWLICIAISADFDRSF